MKSKLCGTFYPLIESKEAESILGIDNGTLENYRLEGISPAYFEAEGTVKYALPTILHYYVPREKRRGWSDPFSHYTGKNVCSNCLSFNSALCRIAEDRANNNIAAHNALGTVEVRSVADMADVQTT